MTVKQSWWRRGFTLPLAVGALLACGIRQDEFDCENAVAHLQDCCPGFQATSVSCQYNDGCDTTYPAIDISQSDCIRQASCQTLVSRGICDRAMRAPLGSSSSTVTTTYAICPPGPAAPAASDGTPGRDAANTLECTSAADCRPGLSCCASSLNTSTSSVVASCGPSPCLLGIQLCANTSECAAGHVCALTPLAPGLAVCSALPDASRDALPDTPPASEASIAPESEAAADVGSLPDAESEANPDVVADASDAADVEAGP